MVKRIFALLNREFNGLHEAAILLGISSITSQVLALIRDRIFASGFGASSELDVYYSAFKIPDFIYVSIASFVSITVLVPFIVEKIEGNGRNNLNGFLNSVLTFYLIVIVLASVIVYFFIPDLSKIIVPGFTQEESDMFILLSRLMLIQPFLLGLSNLFGSVTQAFRKFFIYALSPILYNIGIIFGAIFLYPLYGAVGLVYGVIAGAFFHFAIQIPAVFKEKIFPQVTTNILWRDIKDVIFLSLPRTITISSHSIALIIMVSIASYMEEGSIAIFNFSLNLHNVPLSIIGVSYSVAAFPTLARLFSNGERKKFINQIVTAGRHILFWSIPVTALFIVLRAQIVRSILGAGEFDWSDTRLTAAALALFVVSISAQGLVLLFVRAYYAAGNTRKPLIINVLSSSVIIFLGYFLTKMFSSNDMFRYFIESLFKVSDMDGTSMLMLPLSFSIGMLLNVSLLWGAFRMEFSDYYESIRRVFFQAFGGAVLMGFVAHRFLRLFDDIFDINTLYGIFMQGFLSGVIAIAFGILILRLLKNKEISEISKSLHSKFWKARPIQGDQSLP